MTRQMFFTLLFAVFILMDGLWWWWADRRVRRLGAGWVWRAVLGVFCGGLIGAMVYFIFVPRSVRSAHEWLPVWPHVLIYLWHMVVLPLTWVGIGLAALGRVGAGLIGRRWLRKGARAAAALESPRSSGAGLSRRQFLGGAAAALPPVAGMALSGYAVARLDEFRVNDQTVFNPDLPPDLDGLRIAHVSDMHVGKFTLPGLLPRAVEATNMTPDGQRPDLILLTGDLIDLSIRDLPRALEFVRALRPLHGLAMCEGNHDLIDDPDAFRAGVRRAGVPLLVSETMSIDLPGRATPVQLLGLPWGVAGNGDRRGGPEATAIAMSRLLPQRRPEAFPILLSHHPHAFDPAAAAGIPLTLSGHTHGGQICIGSFRPARWIYRYYSGLYRKGASHCFVSNGVGDWFPLRVGAPAEVVHLTLRRAES